MSRYMPQDVFDMCAVSAVKIHMRGGGSLGDVCTEVCKAYANYYRDDRSFPLEIMNVSEKILEWGRSFGDDQVPLIMTQIQYCLTYYEVDGAKKKKRFLNGALFRRPKTHNPNRAKTVCGT